MEQEEVSQIAKSWVQDIAAAMGVNLKFDDDGICNLQINDNMDLVIEISTTYPMLYIYGPLVTLSSENSNQAFLLMARALELNAFQSLTRGGAIAAVPGEGLLIFCYTMHMEGSDSEKLSRVLGSIVETIEELKVMLLEQSRKVPVKDSNKPPLNFIKV